VIRVDITIISTLTGIIAGFLLRSACELFKMSSDTLAKSLNSIFISGFSKLALNWESISVAKVSNAPAEPMSSSGLWILVWVLSSESVLPDINSAYLYPSSEMGSE
jgi:hypothetical protein